MIPFLLGLFIGGTLGIVAMGIVAAGKMRDDDRLNKLIFRALAENAPLDWPYRVEAYRDASGLLVREYYDDDDELHHTDRETRQ